ncbi:hypothetical protein KIW84_046090 [Lathyrus oleraceus]|uniref:Uncharacterized protein n=1 Tax=Pisum sativum TaxID=3888 RepID=A0A9D4XKS2_PEA|nr:hypothetical protein KIW84_046090 [Pisum sativum]
MDLTSQPMALRGSLQTSLFALGAVPEVAPSLTAIAFSSVRWKQKFAKREVKHGQDFVVKQETVKNSASMWRMLFSVLVTVKVFLVLLVSAISNAEQ